MTSDVLVVGGYGVVGRPLSQRLAERDDCHVIAAGRSLERAAAFADSHEGVVPRRVDLADPSTFGSALEGIDCVVVCVTTDDTAFVRATLERGIDYVDLSPSDEFHRAVEKLDDVARTGDARALLSVGLSPGVTNLLAVDAAERLETVKDVRIAVLLGVGEEIGRDTYEWAVDRSYGQFTVREHGGDRVVRSLSDPWTVTLPGHRRRRLYRYDLADQHALARTADYPSVGTWLCYDSRVATSLLAAGSWTGATGVLVDRLDRDRVVDGLVRIADRSPLGGDPFVALAAVTGRVGGQRETVRRWIRGQDQGRATALAAASMTAELLDADTPPGVHHSHEVLDVESIGRDLRTDGYRGGVETTTDGRKNSVEQR
ncbi:saccharopine dehydrogenase family protein [Halobaculum lipolyticum]|uniref:Saccharopine dehydrogenase family protein n=1 Tax=Halobaculum lipolyticum TaxID=3032001 RepID=A0ABD5WB09_9EURY|nr:saccharopine dehydrogenase NADP-binding domain-containing protein [Halobaculum sp. DT31]